MMSRDSGTVPRRAHNPKVPGSNPGPATDGGSPRRGGPSLLGASSPATRSRSSRLGLLLRVRDQTRGVDVERLGDLREGIDRDVPVAAFDERDVRAVEPGLLGERLLRHTELFTAALDRASDARGDGHVARLAGAVTQGLQTMVCKPVPNE